MFAVIRHYHFEKSDTAETRFWAHPGRVRAHHPQGPGFRSATRGWNGGREGAQLASSKIRPAPTSRCGSVPFSSGTKMAKLLREKPEIVIQGPMKRHHCSWRLEDASGDWCTTSRAGTPRATSARTGSPCRRRALEFVAHGAVNLGATPVRRSRAPRTETQAAGNSQVPSAVIGFSTVFCVTFALFKYDTSMVGLALISNTRPPRIVCPAI